MMSDYEPTESEIDEGRRLAEEYERKQRQRGQIENAPVVVLDEEDKRNLARAVVDEIRGDKWLNAPDSTDTLMNFLEERRRAREEKELAELTESAIKEAASSQTGLRDLLQAAVEIEHAEDRQESERYKFVKTEPPPIGRADVFNPSTDFSYAARRAKREAGGGETE